MSKKKNSEGGFVYSTNPSFRPDDEPEEDKGSLKPGEQLLTVHRETKHRGGKTAIIIRGFSGSAEELKELGKKIKNRCGVGGSAADDEILIQGDIREKVMKVLEDLGYRAKRVGG